jgi:hypothetical protein
MTSRQSDVPFKTMEGILNKPRISVPVFETEKRLSHPVSCNNTALFAR